MKKLLWLLILLPFTALGADRITALVTITNTPADSDTFTLNASVRTWKTSVATPGTQILIGADVNESATNMFNQAASTPFANVIVSIPATNQVQFVGNTSLPMSASIVGTWGYVTYSTQVVAPMFTVRIPIDSEPSAAQRTNVASEIVRGAFNLGFSTNLVSATSTAMSNFLNNATAQTFSGAKTFLTAGFWSGLTTTNLVNYGNAISSRGTSPQTEQFGFGADASGAVSLAVGNNSEASGDSSAAIGGGALASALETTAVGQSSGAEASGATAVGASAAATGVNSMAYGRLSEATAENSGAFGFSASATFADSYAFGNDVSTTATNQIVLGDTHWVYVPGGLSATTISNSTLTNITALYGVLGTLTNGMITNATHYGGTVSNVLLYANLGYMTNGYWTNAAVRGPLQAFITDTTTLSLGTNANATGGQSIAIGNGATAAFTNSGAIGSGVSATITNQIFIGQRGQVNTTFGNNFGTAETYPAGMLNGLALTNGTLGTGAPANGAFIVPIAGALRYRASATDEGTSTDNYLHNRTSVVVGSGTDYSLTTTYAFVNFGGTDPEFNTLPTAGTWIITCAIDVVAGGAKDQYYFKLHDLTAVSDIANSEVRSQAIDNSGEFENITLTAVYTITAPARIQLWAQNASTNRGTITSTRTKMMAIRLY